MRSRIWNRSAPATGDRGATARYGGPLAAGIVVFALVFAVAGSLPTPVHALPSFARGQGMTCASCHTVWPQLTETGRQFKESGYDFAEKTEISKDLTLEKNMPISARLNLRLVDKRTSKRKTTGDLTDKDKQFKLRALHEVEVWMAGRAGEKWSYFAELEAEDEWPDPNGDGPGFQVQMAMGMAQFHPRENVALTAGFGNPLFADPYNTLNYRKPVRLAWAPFSKGFTPGDQSQFVSISGRPVEQVFLLGAFHGNSGLLEGNDARDFTLRGAVDAIPEVTIGGYFNFEKMFDSAVSLSTDEFIRAGGDVQVAYEGLNAHGLFGILNNRAADTTENTFGVELNYLRELEHATVGPVVSVSGYTMNDGNDTFVIGGFFANVNISNNARVQFGWEGDLSVPDAIEHKESRLTLVGDLAF